MGRGGTEIVRLLGETDPSVDPKNEDLILNSYIPRLTMVLKRIFEVAIANFLTRRSS